MHQSHITSLLFNAPLMIEPSKLDAIILGLSSRLGVNSYAPAPGLYTTHQGERKDSGYRQVGNVAVIDVHGVTAHRGGFGADSSYVLGYNQIARRMHDAVSDPHIKSIVLSMDSPGGEVSGAFDLAQSIYSARQHKPVIAVANDVAASAGYLIASAASELYVTQTAQVGSIGVVMRHADFSKKLDADGIQVTHIFAGKHKVDGNAYEPLPDDVRDKFAQEINAVYGMFVSAVAKHRGIQAEAVRSTEAGMFMPEVAIKSGLADGVQTLDETIDKLLSKSGGAGSRRNMQSTMEKTQMTEETNSEPTQIDVDAVKKEAHAVGFAEGQTAERARIGEILCCDEAEGREALAKHFAFATDMNAEAAKKSLAVSPVAAVASTETPLERAMKETEQPNISDDDSDDAKPQKSSLLSSYRAATGQS